MSPSSDRRRRAVGVLGGTFDPVHVGHLRIAEAARSALELERVLLLPAAAPPHKSPWRLAPIEHREAMLRLAIEGRNGLELCRLESDPGKTGYTIQTLRSLRRDMPGHEPVFILGIDALLQIGTWRDHLQLLREFDLVAIDRPRTEREARPPEPLAEVAERIVRLADGAGVTDLQPGRGGRVFLLTVPPVDVSSSRIRRCAATGRSLDGLVPPAVAGYIQRTGIYRREETS